MSTIIKQSEPADAKIDQESVQTISVENAIKELLALGTK